MTTTYNPVSTSAMIVMRTLAFCSTITDKLNPTHGHASISMNTPAFNHTGTNTHSPAHGCTSIGMCTPTSDGMNMNTHNPETGCTSIDMYALASDGINTNTNDPAPDCASIGIRALALCNAITDTHSPVFGNTDAGSLNPVSGSTGTDMHSAVFGSTDTGSLNPVSGTTNTGKYDPVRYSIIPEKNPREIVMLRGNGCKWRRCKFCDYHLDFSPERDENFAINKAALAQVTGIYGRLEVINSGSIVDLDGGTLALIRSVCQEKYIDELHFECHYMHRSALPAYRSYFADAGINVKIKIGVETFDADYRERELDKGIPERDPARIAEGFDEVCLLFGLRGQDAASMKADIETGLAHFERVCVNLMMENTTPVRPDAAVIADFMQNVYPLYRDNTRVDILQSNTDFGVGKGQ